jgi:hypothetical protein
MVKSWKKINSRIAYKNPWFRVREDSVKRPDGKQGIYGVVERPHTNFIIGLVDKNKILLIQEFRYPVQRKVWQLPAGTTDKGETDLRAAKRELLHETCYQAQIWKKVGSFFIAPGHESIIANIFLAINCVKSVTRQNRNSNEMITNICAIPMRQVKKMIRENKIKCGITLAALNVLFQQKNRESR